MRITAVCGAAALLCLLGESRGGSHPPRTPSPPPHRFWHAVAAARQPVGGAIRAVLQLRSAAENRRNG